MGGRGGEGGGRCDPRSQARSIALDYQPCNEHTLSETRGLAGSSLSSKSVGV